MKKKLIIALMFIISAVGFASYESDLTERMGRIEESLEEYYEGSTVDVRYATYESYEAWDKELNKVYKLLMSKLPQKQQASLRQEQREWLKKRDREAEKSGKEFEGGTYEDIMYTAGLSRETKQRTIELAKRYDRLNRK